MTQFNESKLSKIIARRIMSADDKAYLLPMCTPIYCPEYNGVRTSRVTVINPNTNSFTDTVDGTTDTTVVGATITNSAASINPLIDKEGTLSVSDIGIVTSFGTSNYLAVTSPSDYNMDFIHMVGNLPSNRTQPINIVAATSSVVETITVQPNGNITLTRGSAEASNIGKAKDSGEFYIEIAIHNSQINVTLRHITENNGDLKETILPEGKVTLLSFGASSESTYSVDLSQSFYTLGDDTKVPMFNPGRSATKIASNTFDIDLNIPVSHTYFVPHEVDLETDVDLQNMIKSDYAVRLKRAVSNQILGIITETLNADNGTLMIEGATAASYIGKAIADNLINGTGQKYSIYKYSNGAPVVYNKSSNAPCIDNNIVGQTEDDTFATRNDISVPALYFIEKPTLLLNNDELVNVQTALCNGDLKSYATNYMNIDYAKMTLPKDAIGVFGTNDTFAVAFTEAIIKRQPDKDFYADNVTVTSYIGVKLVHTNNLRFIKKGS